MASCKAAEGFLRDKETSVFLLQFLELIRSLYGAVRAQPVAVILREKRKVSESISICDLNSGDKY